MSATSLEGSQSLVKRPKWQKKGRKNTCSHYENRTRVFCELSGMMKGKYANPCTKWDESLTLFFCGMCARTRQTKKNGGK